MSDEIFSAVYARPKRRQGITGQTIDAQMRGTMCQITEWELEELRDELARLRAEVERLTGALEGALADSARLTLALAEEREHADALAKLVDSQVNEFWTWWDDEAEKLLAQHRARRSP